ncbi:MAG: hypothetical protein M0R38_12015 [Bacteroidia bacterium]|nr:hypothetical protein [Bacteroidia bacterium]
MLKGFTNNDQLIMLDTLDEFVTFLDQECGGIFVQKEWIEETVDNVSGYVYYRGTTPVAFANTVVLTEFMLNAEPWLVQDRTTFATEFQKELIAALGASDALIEDAVSQVTNALEERATKGEFLRTGYRFITNKEKIEE